MADYDFYKTVYQGNGVSQTAFPEVIARAERWLGKLERQFRVNPCVPNGRDMALCAIAENLTADGKRCLTESAVGDVKVKFFHEEDPALYRRIYNRISCFLEIKRGVQ